MQKCYFYLEALVGLPAFGTGMQSPWSADDLWVMPALHHQPKRNLLPMRGLRHLLIASMLPVAMNSSKQSSFIAVADD